MNRISQQQQQQQAQQQQLRGGPGRMRIRAFPITMDERYVDSIWNMLKNAIQEIQNKNNSGLSFEELYRNAYTLILHKYGERLYNGTREVVNDHLQQKVRQTVLDALNDNFLHVLNVSWTEHQTAMMMIRDILMYMDRVYVSQNDVSDVYTLGMILFRDTIVQHAPINAKLQQTLLNMVGRHRIGEAIEQQQVKSACQMLMSLGQSRIDRTIYEENFEKPFLKQSADFFRREAQQYLTEHSATLYARKVHGRLQQEAERAKHYLDPSSEEPVRQVVKDEMIVKYMKDVVNMEGSGVVFMIENRRENDLQCLFELLQMVPTGIECMLVTLSEHLHKRGEALVKQDSAAATAAAASAAAAADAAAGAGGAAGDRQPVTYVKQLIELKDEYDRYLTHSFESDQKCKQAIAKEFEQFLNANSKSPEYLSLFIDDKLKKGNKSSSDDEVEQMLDKAMALFRFLNEKDVFERYYKQHLAKRLLFNRSNSEDMEKQMISKLKHECGTQFTAKLEGMFKDMSVSQVENKEFTNQLANNSSALVNVNGNNNSSAAAAANSLKVDLFVHVLTTGCWPMPAQQTTAMLPHEAELAFERFKSFYLGKHSGRKLSLQANLGNAEVLATFYGAPKAIDGGGGGGVGGADVKDELLHAPPSPQAGSSRGGSQQNAAVVVAVGAAGAAGHGIALRTHILQVNTPQMIILMLFNDQPEWTFQEILTHTQLGERDLIRQLQSLAMSKSSQRVLQKMPRTKDISAGDKFSVNESFTSRLRRVKIIQVVAKGDNDGERQETRTKVEEDRKHEIEAAIVRIMKARKEMQFQQLVGECIEQLKHRFMPKVQNVKNRIENLIEREYLQRDAADMKRIKYVA